jgi:hypothetical protein
MPRRSILSAAERASLLLPPDTEDERKRSADTSTQKRLIGIRLFLQW